MWCALGVQNGLIWFPLFLMGKIDSTYKDFDLRVAPQNGLSSYLEVPLYAKKANSRESLPQCAELKSDTAIRDAAARQNDAPL